MAAEQPSNHDPVRPSTLGFGAAARLLQALEAETPEASRDAGDGSNRSDGSERASGSELGGSGAAGAQKSQADQPRIAGYTIERRLGGGGGGTVYLARRDGSDRPLALKLLNHRLSCTRDEQRAWRELNVLESLRLPAVPRLIDYGVHDGRMFIATEFVEGTPLSELGPSIRSDLKACAALLAKIADAVQSLHEHGVIHRDVKPSNIIISRAVQIVPPSSAALSRTRCEPPETHKAKDAPFAAPLPHSPSSPLSPLGDPVIIDLGLAAILADDPAETLTAEGVPLGTPAFMAPEQARGEREKVSTRSDVYGLGATGYWLMTGKTPHDCECSVHEAVRRVAQEPARGARELKGTMPKPLAAVLSKACAAAPEQRYVSAGAFAADLGRWLRSEPVSAVGAGPLAGAFRWVARHPLAATAFVCLAIAACIIGGTATVVWWMNTRPFAFEVSADGSYARIRSRTESTVQEWRRADSMIITGNELNRPSELGGGRVLQISGIAGPYEQELCLFDWSDFSKPYWHSGIGPPDIVVPAGRVCKDPPNWPVRGAVCDDVFPESPGKELIASHCNYSGGSSCVRVYDLRGEVLFEAWHNGWLLRPQWVPGSRALVTPAYNNDAVWNQRGHPGVKNSKPVVIIMIRPEFRRRAGWITTPDRPGDFEPLMYRCLLPPDAAGIFDSRKIDTCASLASEAPAIIRLFAPGTDDADGWICLLVDPAGRIIRRDPSDGFLQRHPPGSSGHVFFSGMELGEMPAMTPSPPTDQTKK